MSRLPAIPSFSGSVRTISPRATRSTCAIGIAQIGRTVGEPNLKVNWMVGGAAERIQMVATAADLECGNTTQMLTRLTLVDFRT